MNTAVLVSYLQHQRLIVDYTYISAAALVIYDYILTIQLEIKLVWFSRWTYTKIIVLINRYLAFISLILLLYHQLFIDVSLAGCKVAWPFQAWTALPQIVFAGSVLAVRTWALWARNPFVGIGLAILWVATLVGRSIVLNDFVRSFKYLPPPYKGFRGCLIKTTAKTFFINWVVLTISDFVMFALVAISAFRSHKSGSSSKLSTVVHRDGLLSYIFLLGITAASVVIDTVMSADMRTMITPQLFSLYAMLTTRMVLNMRETSNLGMDTELHTAPLAFVMPLKVVRDDHLSDSEPISHVNHRGSLI